MKKISKLREILKKLEGALPPEHLMRTETEILKHYIPISSVEEIINGFVGRFFPVVDGVVLPPKYTGEGNVTIEEIMKKADEYIKFVLEKLNTEEVKE